MKAFEELIAERRAESAARQNEINAEASRFWESFNEDERALVRFGLMPVRILDSPLSKGKDLAVAIMDCAKRDGGMIA